MGEAEFLLSDIPASAAFLAFVVVAAVAAIGYWLWDQPADGPAEEPSDQDRP